MSEAVTGPRSERIGALDALRGVAVLCILGMNLISFAGPENWYVLPTEGPGGVEGGNFYVWAVQRLVLDQKFMSIFTMLFGAGIILSTVRTENERGTATAAWLHYRRVGILFGFGMLHAYLVWHGDILVGYAIIGALAFLMRRLSPWWLLMSGAGAILACGVLWQLMFSGLWAAVTFDDAETAESFLELGDYADEAAAFTGGYVDQLHWRLMNTPLYQVNGVFLFGLKIFGQMVLGMALLKLAVFGPDAGRRARVWVMAIGLGVGVPLMVADVWISVAKNFDPLWSFTGAFLFNYWGSVFLALGYVGVLVSLFGTLPGAVVRPFAAVGRMAFTNYLLQSLIGTTLFYGFGLGWWGTMDRVDLVWVFLALTAAQLVWSLLWLAVCRFGPMEWLWRNLTYWRVQPIMRSGRAKLAA
jgi:uncharacterized protein